MAAQYNRIHYITFRYLHFNFFCPLIFDDFELLHSRANILIIVFFLIFRCYVSIFMVITNAVFWKGNWRWRFVNFEVYFLLFLPLQLVVQSQERLSFNVTEG